MGGSVDSKNSTLQQKKGWWGTRARLEASQRKLGSKAGGTFLVSPDFRRDGSEVRTAGKKIPDERLRPRRPRMVCNGQRFSMVQQPLRFV